MKILLAKKEKHSCLIFDEIDSNVGGQTAAILGQKLQTLSGIGQIICITHFVQVARSANHHFLVNKAIMGDSSETQICKLNRAQLAAEYDRMTGKTHF